MLRSLRDLEHEIKVGVLVREFFAISAIVEPGNDGGLVVGSPAMHVGRRRLLQLR